MFSTVKNSAKSLCDFLSTSVSWVLKNQKSMMIFSLLLVSGKAFAKEERLRLFTNFDCGVFEFKFEHELIEDNCYKWNAMPHLFFCSTTAEEMESIQNKVFISDSHHPCKDLYIPKLNHF